MEKQQTLPKVYGYWTKEKCYELASHYKEMKTFRENEKSAYNAAVRHGWLKDYTWLSHQIRSTKQKKKRQSYTQEEIIDRLRSIFGNCYSYEKVDYKAMKVPITLVCHAKDENGVEHGEFSMRPDNIFSGKQRCPKCWKDRRGITQRKTTEQFIAEAQKVHGNKYEYFKVEYLGDKTKVCILCPIHGDFWQLPFNHLKGKGCPYCSGNAKKWNKETCEQEARKYEYIAEFRIKSAGACNVASRNGWIEDYTWLKRLPPIEDDYLKGEKYIYAYEFPESNAVYVGLTNSIKKRDWQHRHGESSVYNYAHRMNIEIPQPIILEEYVPISESGAKEHYWVEQYETANWTILNRAKTGKRSSSIGATYPLKWTKKSIREKAKECDYDLKTFSASYPGAYLAIQTRYKGLLSELFPQRHIHTHYSVDDALMVVEKGSYENRSQLRNKCLWAYRVLFNANKLDEVFGKPKEYTREEALKEADNYKSIESIRLENHSLWNYLKKNGLFRTAKPTDAMFRRVKTVEEAWNLSLYYNSITDLSNHAKAAYKILKDNGLLQKRYPESIKYRKEPTFDECKEVYNSCSSLKELKEHHHRIYYIAVKNHWHDELKEVFRFNDIIERKESDNVVVKKNISHKTSDSQRKSHKISVRKWTRKSCEEIVKKYVYLKDFTKNESKVYQAITRNGWGALLSSLKRVQHSPYHYTMDEIKEICKPYHSLVELSKARKDIENYCRKKGINLYELNGWINLRNRKISQFLNGKEIAVYSSLSEAARAINVPRNRMWEHIGKDEPYMGYYWKYKY